MGGKGVYTVHGTSNIFNIKSKAVEHALKQFKPTAAALFHCHHASSII